jgi:lysophospholipase L1-like esterase
VLLLAPPPVAKLTKFAEMFEGAEEKSRRLGPHYRRVAAEMGCHFLDTYSVIVSSDLDGIHFAAVERENLGSVVAAKVREILQ